jgi:hypothetical protein
MAISDTTLSVDVWNSVKDAIVAIAPKVTNTTTGTTTLVSVRASYNDEKDKPPMIVIEPVSKTEDNWKFSSSEGKKIINVSVSCFGNNGLQADQLYDQIESKLKLNDISGIDLIGITTDYAFNISNQSKVQLKSGVFSYDRE